MSSCICGIVFPAVRCIRRQISGGVRLQTDKWREQKAAQVTVRDSAEEELALRATAGDRSSFEQLYFRYKSKITSLVFRVLKESDDVEEVVQEVFYQAFRGIGNFRGNSTFYTWIYRVGTNVALQHLKKKRYRRGKIREAPFEEALQVPGNPALFGICPDKELDRKKFTEALRACIDRLPYNQRAVIILGPIQGHSYFEMGQILGVSEDMIKGRLHRARENMKVHLQNFREGLPAQSQFLGHEVCLATERPSSVEQAVDPPRSNDPFVSGMQLDILDTKERAERFACALTDLENGACVLADAITKLEVLSEKRAQLLKQQAEAKRIVDDENYSFAAREWKDIVARVMQLKSV